MSRAVAFKWSHLARKQKGNAVGEYTAASKFEEFLPQVSISRNWAFPNRFRPRRSGKFGPDTPLDYSIWRHTYRSRLCPLACRGSTSRNLLSRNRHHRNSLRCRDVLPRRAPPDAYPVWIRFRTGTSRSHLHRSRTGRGCHSYRLSSCLLPHS